MIISLTSIPPRFGGLGPALGSLTDQGADAVWLWIPHTYDRFPDWDGTLPDVPAGITIRRCKTDHGPATKSIPALKQLAPGTRVLICDDDVIYAPNWAAGFGKAARTHADCAIAASAFPARRAGLGSAPDDALIVQGFAGVSLTPEMIPAPVITARDKWVDDIWLSAMLAASGTKIHHAPHLRKLASPQSAPASLQDNPLNGQSRGQNNATSARGLAHDLGIWGAPAP